MKKIFSVTALAFILALTISFSCDNDRNNPVAPQDQTYTLTGKIFYIYSYGQIEEVTIYLTGNAFHDSTQTDSDGNYWYKVESYPPGCKGALSDYSLGKISKDGMIKESSCSSFDYATRINPDDKSKYHILYRQE